MKTSQFTLIGILLLIALMPFAHAAAPAANATIITQPSSIAANEGYSITFRVNDSANDTVNITVKLLVAGVNVANKTWLVGSSSPGNNTYTAAFTENYYVQGQTIRTNITVVESGNASLTNYTLSSTLTASMSTTALIANDTLEGLPSSGGFIGDFMGNLAPGLFKFLLLIGIGVAIVALIVAIIGIVKKQGIKGFK